LLARRLDEAEKVLQIQFERMAQMQVAIDRLKPPYPPLPRAK
jgi:hypothetical protein